MWHTSKARIGEAYYVRFCYSLSPNLSFIDLLSFLPFLLPIIEASTFKRSISNSSSPF
ncbi:hypothetical protein HanXRQr2_Chr10g0449161 [Helianthus annuus]|uniref:Uncharacterized protein n=1 Tax=Helianthus annuus TaxID=4232 RepID=A0A9K3HY63_HELAN|nr:hypothetical protein HanXRQr2_Chr10g0449161 [Helianthus annuus]KAJ0522588.1 hypothetical protein HanIR_Chr10g0484231 [Helianthus annuus]KAJ0884427.1 hypothetical protein HanPSC8_Chr10g0433581 [Helianthus annuus]